MEEIRWGILATGAIAHEFAANLRFLPDARVSAVASRFQESADSFAAEFDVPTAHAGYERLAEDPEVDVVYVASPHGLHYEHVRMLLEAGKPVLCEKAFTLNAAQAEDLLRLARDRGLFLMEAMWMACHPLVRHLAGRVRGGELGSPRHLVAELGWRVDRPATDRMFNPALGGGALLDMGVYTLTLAQLFLGEPTRQTAVGNLSESGIDLDVVVTAAYASGALAALSASMTAPSSEAAALATDRGRLTLPSPFHHPAHAIWTEYPDGAAAAPVRIESPEPVIGTGLANEAAEVMRCLRESLVESPMVPHAQTLAVMRQMDALRAQVAVAYPGEGPPRYDRGGVTSGPFGG